MNASLTGAQSAGGAEREAQVCVSQLKWDAGGGFHAGRSGAGGAGRLGDRENTARG